VALPTASSEICERNPHAVGDPRHAAAGDELLERFLQGTDDEGFRGDRVLVGRAREWFSAVGRGGAPTIGEVYRLRSADRVEVLFLGSSDNPRAIAGLPGRFEVGFAHAIEVTRRDEIAFRSSPCWRRVGGRGWILIEPGEALAVPRASQKDDFVRAQSSALETGWSLAGAAAAAAATFGSKPVDAVALLARTSLPRSVRERASARLASVASLADVVVTLADVASSSSREEGETYARAAGRVLQRAEAWSALSAPSAEGAAGATGVPAGTGPSEGAGAGKGGA